MYKAESIKIELRLHEALFFFSVIGLLLMLAWIFGHFESAAWGWRLAAILLAGTAAAFSVWNYRQFKNLLEELKKA